MKQLFTLIMPILFSIGCNKITDPANEFILPNMEYTDFGNKAIAFNQQYNVDLNHDGTRDFSVYTLLVADGLIHTDYRQYYFGSAKYTAFPINAHEEVPLLQKNALINADAFPDYSWWTASDIVMAQKVVPLNCASYWQGNWLNAAHNYLPINIQIGDDIFYGWVEMSFNQQNETVILHSAAINKEKYKPVLAGR